MALWIFCPLSGITPIWFDLCALEMQGTALVHWQTSHGGSSLIPLCVDLIINITPFSSLFAQQAQSPPPSQVIFCGLRVRMGMHCGISDPQDVTVDPASNQTSYSG